MSFKKGSIQGKKKQRGRTYTTDGIDIGLSQKNRSRKEPAKTTDNISDIEKLADLDKQKADLKKQQAAFEDNPNSSDALLLRKKIEAIDAQLNKLNSQLPDRPQVRPRDWWMLEKKQTIKNLTSYGDPDIINQAKREKYDAPSKAKKPFEKLLPYRLKKLNNKEKQQYRKDLAANLAQENENKLIAAVSKTYVDNVEKPALKKDGANSFKKTLSLVQNAKNDNDAALMVKHKTRIIEHTTEDETMWGAEKATMMATSSSSNQGLIGITSLNKNNVDVKQAMTMVPWLKVNDFYTATTIQGPEGWPNLVKLLNEQDKAKKDFVILTGSHMDILGMTVGSDNKFDWNYGTNVSKTGDWSPVDFYEEDLGDENKTLDQHGGAKRLIKELKNISLEVRDIWHPDLPKPDAETLRAEVKELIASGKTVICAVCYSSDMFMKKVSEPKTAGEYATYMKDIQTKRNIPVKDFVNQNWGNTSDFKTR